MTHGLGTEGRTRVTQYHEFEILGSLRSTTQPGERQGASNHDIENGHTTPRPPLDRWGRRRIRWFRKLVNPKASATLLGVASDLFGDPPAGPVAHGHPRCSDGRLLADPRSCRTRRLRATPPVLVPDQPGRTPEAGQIHQFDHRSVLHAGEYATLSAIFESPHPRSLKFPTLSPVS